MLTEFLAALGVLAVLTMVPGPDMAVVTRRAVAASPRDGLRTAGGVVTGLMIWAALTVVGLAALLAASATAFLVVKVVGAAYLVVLGVQALLQSRRTHSETEPLPGHTPGNPWRTGLATNLLNPKIAIFYAGLLPTLAPAALPAAAGMLLLASAHAAMTIVWLGGYVLLLSRARAFFARPAVRRGIDRVAGVVLIGFGVRIALTHS